MLLLEWLVDSLIFDRLAIAKRHVNNVLGVQKMLSCSHERSYRLFTESIITGDRFQGYPCADYKEFLRGQCTSCTSNGCPSFGYDSIKHKGKSSGKFYLMTSNDSPYLGTFFIHLLHKCIISKLCYIVPN